MPEQPRTLNKPCPPAALMLELRGGPPTPGAHPWAEDRSGPLPPSQSTQAAQSTGGASKQETLFLRDQGAADWEFRESSLPGS